MFAVPGWDINPDSLVSEKAHSANVEARQELSNRKRKRKDKAAKESSEAVTTENVDELLNRIVHGAGASEQEKRSNSSKKDKKARANKDDLDGESEQKRRTKKEKKLRHQAEETNGNGNGLIPDGSAMKNLTTQVDAMDVEQDSKSKLDKPAKKKHKKSKDKAEDHSFDTNGAMEKSQDSSFPRIQLESTNDNKADTGPGSNKPQANQNDDPKPSYPFLSKPARPRKTKGPMTSAPKFIPPTLTPLQLQMAEKLQSSRFRHLNETLYTNHSSSTKTLFDETPSSFDDYHVGFARQVSTWPVNPLNTVLERIIARASIQKPLDRKSGGPKGKKSLAKPKQPLLGPLPRSHKGLARIADLGCGTAQLASKLHSTGAATRLKLNVQSFDLVAVNQFVTQADIRSVPVENEQVDLTVLCLALMGTNWVEFVEEAWRITKWKGEVWIVEVVSRFARMGDRDRDAGGKDNGGDKLSYKDRSKAKEKARADDATFLAQEIDGVTPAVDPENTDLDPFLQVCRSRGLILDGVPEKNKMFVSMRFLKTATPTKGRFVPEQIKARVEAGRRWKGEEEGEISVEEEGKVLKPCLYKAR